MKFLPLIVLSTAAGAFARGGGDSSEAEADDYMGMSMGMGMGMGEGGRGSGGGGGRWRNGTSTESSTSPRSQCRHLAQLTALSNLASNPAKLAEIMSQIEAQDPAQAASFQSQVSSAASQLATLQQNATLVSTCAPVLTEMQMRQGCRAMSQMEKLASLAGDPAKLAEKTRNDTAKMDKIRQMVAAEGEDLAALQGNSTLTRFCSVLDTEDDCRKMKKLERMLSKNGNGTASASASAEGWGGRRGGGGGRKGGGGHRNETSGATSTGAEAGGDGGNSEDKAQKWQAKLAEKKAELEGLKSNATLVQMCATMDSSDHKATTGGSSSSGGGGAPDDGVVIAGTAKGLRPFGTMVMGLATVLLFGLLVL